MVTSYLVLINCDYTLELRWGELAGTNKQTRVFFKENLSREKWGCLETEFQIAVHVSNSFQTCTAFVRRIY